MIKAIVKIGQYLSGKHNGNDFPDILWLSLGENCLPDNILHRHGLKSFSSPYSHGRSNLDYALNLEKAGYVGLLDPENLVYGISETKQVVRSTVFNQCENIYNSMHMKGFEMTHHDVIGSAKDLDTFRRKVARQNEIRGHRNVVFFYHHRINKNSDLDQIFSKAETFAALYSGENAQCDVVVFTQKIIPAKEERKVSYRRVSRKVHFFEFSTTALWGGKDDDLFWARVDDDLIGKMTGAMVHHKKTGKKIPEGFLK